jgi:hypothetical protein
MVQAAGCVIGSNKTHMQTATKAQYVIKAAKVVHPSYAEYPVRTQQAIFSSTRNWNANTEVEYVDITVHQQHKRFPNVCMTPMVQASQQSCNITHLQVIAAVAVAGHAIAHFASGILI